MRRILLLFAAAAMLAVLFAMAASPAFANHRDHNFFRFHDNDDFGLNFDDQDLRSGDIDTDTSISVEGNNNNQCVGLTQFGNTGNFANQQGTSNFGGDEFNDDNNDHHWWNGPWWRFHDNDFRDDNDGNDGFEQDFRGPEVTFDVDNETGCDQGI